MLLKKKKKKDTKLIKDIVCSLPAKKKVLPVIFFIKYISSSHVALSIMNFAAPLCHSLRPHKIVFNDLLNIHFQWMQ